MDFKPYAVLASGVAMMAAGVYCLDPAPEAAPRSISLPIPPARTAPAGASDFMMHTASAGPLPASAMPVSLQVPGSTVSSPDGEARMLRVHLAVREGRGVAGPRFVHVAAGAPVAFRIDADVADRFTIEGYGVSVTVAPGRSGIAAFDATRPGRYRYGLERSGLVLGELEVVSP